MLSTRILRDAIRPGVIHARVRLPLAYVAAQMRALRTRETKEAGPLRRFGSRGWERRRRRTRQRAFPIIACKLVAVSVICAAAVSAILPSDTGEIPVRELGQAILTALLPDNQSRLPTSFTRILTTASKSNVPAAFPEIYDGETGSDPLALSALPAHVVPAPAPPDLPLPRNTPLANADERLTNLPVLAAILPGAAEISGGLQFALEAEPLNAASTIPVLPGDTVDRFLRSGPPGEPETLREPANPLYAAIDLEAQRGNPPRHSGLDPERISARAELYAPRSTPGEREWSIEPHQGFPSSDMPRNPFLAAIPPQHIGASPAPREAIGTGSLDVPSALYGPPAGAHGRIWRSRNPQDSGAALAPKHRLTATLHPTFYRISGGPEQSFDSGSLDAPSALHTPSVASPQWSWRSRQPRMRGAADVPPNPLTAAFHPVKANIRPGPQFSFDSDSLEAPSALHTPPVGNPEWGWRSPRRNREGAAYLPQNPIATKVHPVHAAPVPAPLQMDAAASLDSPAVAPSRHAALMGRSPRKSPPEAPVLALTPRNSLQATLHVLDADPVSAPRRLVGVAAFNAPTIPRSTLAASVEANRQIAPPEGPLLALAPRNPLQATLHLLDADSVSAPRRLVGVAAFNAPTIPRSTLAASVEANRQIAPPEGPLLALAPRNPLQATLHLLDADSVSAPRRLVGVAAFNAPTIPRSTLAASVEANRQIAPPEGPLLALAPRNPLQATLHLLDADSVSAPRRLVGVAAFNAPTIPRSTLAAPVEANRHIALPEGPLLALAPRNPLTAAIHPAGAESVSEPRSPLGTSPSGSPVTARPANSDPGILSQQIVRRKPLSPMQGSSNPTMAGIHPETHGTYIDRQLALASGPANAAAPPSGLRSTTANRSPGSEGSVEPTSAGVERTPMLAAIPPEAAGVSHGPEFARNAGPPLTPPAPRTLLTLQEDSNRPPAAHLIVDAAPGPVAAVQEEIHAAGAQAGHAIRVSLASAPAEPLGSTRSPLVDTLDPQHAQPAIPEAVPGSPSSAPSQSSVVMASREPEAQSADSNGPRLSSVPLAYDLATTADQADLEGSTASAEESASMQRLPLIRRTVEVRKGDSLLSLLDIHAVPQSTGLTAISRLRPRLDPKRIKAGDRVSFVLDENDEHVTLEELTVARTGQRGLHHHWASQTFEPGDVVDAESVSETPGEVASQVVSAAKPRWWFKGWWRRRKCTTVSPHDDGAVRRLAPRPPAKQRGARLRRSHRNPKDEAQFRPLAVADRRPRFLPDRFPEAE